MKEFELALGYDDISLLPNFSDFDSRKEANTDTIISKNNKVKHGIILAAMDTVSTVESCIEMNKIGAAGILHRFMSIEDQYNKAKKIKEESGKCYLALGLKDVKERLDKLNQLEPDLYFLDSANGLSRRVYEFTKWYKNDSGFKSDLASGNTLTKESVSRLINIGADAIRHLISPGSACLTAVYTGIHVPSIEGIRYAWKALRNWELYANDWQNKNEIKYPAILTDGGCRYPKDYVKSIAAGSHAIIAGGIFVGCIENSKEIVEIDGKPMVKYRGMSSAEVSNEYGLNDGKPENIFSEGDVYYKPYQNRSVKDVVYEFNNGLRSAMSYLNTKNIDELRGGLWKGNVKAVLVSPNSNYEGFAHGKNK